MKLDAKSALFGLCAGVLAMLAIGAASPAIQAGRYQVAGTDNHGLVIDTTTGQVWRHHFAPGQGGSDADFFKHKLGQ